MKYLPYDPGKLSLEAEYEVPRPPLKNHKLEVGILGSAS